MIYERSYRFRLRWTLGPGRSLEDLEGPAIVSLLGIGECEIKLTQAATGGEGHSLALVGPAVGSQEVAMHQAELALGGLLVMTLRNGFAIQLQPRKPPPIITQFGMEWVAQQFLGIDTIYRDRLGISIFEECGHTRFASMGSPTISVTSKLTSFISDWNCAAETSISLRNLIAYELYASSRFESSSRARFLLLVMAVEALGCQIERPEEELAVISQLLEHVRMTGLSELRRNALMDGIRGLKKVSIGETCRRLVTQAIEIAAVTDPDAASHFRDCYRIRGKIVHSGKTPPPSQLSNESNRLEKTVRELITWLLQQNAKNSEELWNSDFAVVFGENDAVHIT
jgi:hypothetical protein